MPFLTIHTNAKVDNKADFLREAADLVATELHKPVRYVIVDLDEQADMIFGGNLEVKSALVEMKSIGFGNKASLAKNLTVFLAEKLNLETAYINIHLINMPGADVSIGGNLLG